MKLKDYPTLSKAFEILVLEENDGSRLAVEDIRKKAYEKELEPRELYDHAEQKLGCLCVSDLRMFVTDVTGESFISDDVEEVLDALFDLGWMAEVGGER
jgi:hypothetical protein